MNTRYLLRKISSVLRIPWLVTAGQPAKTASGPKRKKNRLALPSTWRIFVKAGAARLVALPLVVLIFIGAFVFYHYLSIQPQTYPEENSVLGSKYGRLLNVAVVVYEPQEQYIYGKLFGLLSIDQQSGKQTLLLISPDQAVYVADEGWVKLRHLFNSFGQQKVKNITNSLHQLLGVEIHRYMMISKSDLQALTTDLNLGYLLVSDIQDQEAGNFDSGEVVQGGDLIKVLGADADGIDLQLARNAEFVNTQLPSVFSFTNLAKLVSSPQELTQHLQTDMSRGELMNLFMTMLFSRRLTTSYIPVQRGNTYYDAKEAQYIVPQTQINTIIQGFLGRVEVAKEQARIEIYNATKTGGLAAEYKRLLENLGGIVVRTGNYPDVSEQTKVYIPKIIEFPNTIALIKELLGDDILVLDEQYPLNHTGDVVIVVGEDLGPVSQ